MVITVGSSHKFLDVGKKSLVRFHFQGMESFRIEGDLELEILSCVMNWKITIEWFLGEILSCFQFLWRRFFPKIMKRTYQIFFEILWKMTRGRKRSGFTIEQSWNVFREECNADQHMPKTLYEVFNSFRIYRKLGESGIHLCAVRWGLPPYGSLWTHQSYSL